MRDMATAGKRSRTPGDGRDLDSRSRTAKEVIAGTSGGSQWVGVTSSWTDAPRPGEVGERSGCNRDHWSCVKRCLASCSGAKGHPTKIQYTIRHK